MDEERKWKEKKLKERKGREEKIKRKFCFLSYYLDKEKIEKKTQIFSFSCVVEEKSEEKKNIIIVNGLFIFNLI